MLINFTQTAMTKLLALSKASDNNEIGGLMIGYPSGSQIVVTDITVPKQKVTAASISFDDNSINEQLSELFFNEDEVGLVGEWHTHGKGKVFWSSTDQGECIDKFMKPIVDNPDGELKDKWFAFVVANAAGDLLGRVDYYTITPFGNYIDTLNDVPVVCLPLITDAQIAWAKEQITANVTKYTYTYQSHKSKKGRGKSKDKDLYYDYWSGCYYDDCADFDDGVTIITPAEEATDVVNTVIFSKEDEELIEIAEKTFDISRQTINDLVTKYDYTVSEAIDVLTEELTT